MAIYSKRQLIEQQEIIEVVKALSALTVLRLNQTYGALTEAKALLSKIAESIRRVFEIYPSSDREFRKKQQKYLERFQKKSTLLVLISSNKDVYGNLIRDITDLFISDVKKTNYDALVIGTMGKTFVERENLKSKIVFFDIDDDRLDPRQVTQVSQLTQQYARVIVYHGEEESLIRHKAVRSEVLKQIPQMLKPKKSYFFEPTPEDVIRYLNSQISLNSFHQTVYKGQYARLSARRWNWTKQQMARVRLLEELTREFRKYKKRLYSRQQQVTIFAHRLNVIQSDITKNAHFYG